MAGKGGGRLGRSWRRFQRRPVAVRIGSVVVSLAVIAGIVYAVGLRSSSSPPATGHSGAPTTIVGPSRAATNSAGVTAHTINVVFPVANLAALASNLGFAGDIEYSEQAKAIRLFVKQFNDAGGINGRKINPMIVNFDPTSEVDMRALCKNWTEGNAAVFAVLDGVGTWNGDNQLCITQEGHTPLLSQWTTVTNWTEEGSPYLWWTGPDDAAILQAVVDWGTSSGLLGDGRKVAVVAGDRASDQLALNQYLLPDLKRAGVTAMVETIPSNTSDTASVNAAAPLIVQRLKTAGVESVIPLMPLNSFVPYLAQETQQEYFPKLLLSDYESSIEYGLGLIPFPYGQALEGQEGVTTETLGGVDDDRPEAQGGYDTGDRGCWDIWHKAYPQTPPGNQSDFIEEQGPIQGWCQEIDLFAAAATAAGKDLNRRTFTEAMAHITNFPGGYTPVLSYGPDRYFGPTQFQVVSLHNNVPPSSLCKFPLNHIAQGRCWVTVDTWQPLPTLG
jgi:hypothetical protein